MQTYKCMNNVFFCVGRFASAEIKPVYFKINKKKGKNFEGIHLNCFLVKPKNKFYWTRTEARNERKRNSASPRVFSRIYETHTTHLTLYFRI